MGTLDFVSPNATLAVSLVLREPWAMVSDVFNYLRAEDPNFDQQIQQVYDETGVRLVDDLAKPLGGDFTFAIDGPLMPLPSWKVAVEVYDPARLQWGIEQLVNAFNTHSTCTDCKLTLNKEDANGRTYYTLTSAKVSYEIDYIYVDGYLIAAPSRTLLNTAIQNRPTGYALARSEAFRSRCRQTVLISRAWCTITSAPRWGRC